MKRRVAPTRQPGMRLREFQETYGAPYICSALISPLRAGPLSCSPSFLERAERVSTGEGFPRRLENYVHHDFGVRVHRGVIHAMGTYLRAHAFGHETLGFGVDHAVFFRHEIPRWF